MRRDLLPHRFGEARARLFLAPREAEEEARELDAVVERRGREVVAAQLFMDRHGDGVHQRDYSGHDRNPRVAEGVYGLVAPSRQQFVRRRGGDVAVSVTGRHDGAALVRDSRRRRDDALPVRDSRRWRRRRLGARRKGWRRR